MDQSFSVFVNELEVFYLKKFKDTFMCNNVFYVQFMFMILTVLITDIRLYPIYFYYLNLIYRIILYIRLLSYLYVLLSSIFF